MKPTPKNIGRRFTSGHWVSMLAKEFGINEAHVEMQLMIYIRNLERGKYKRKKERGR